MSTIKKLLNKIRGSIFELSKHVTESNEMVAVSDITTKIDNAEEVFRQTKDIEEN